MRKISRIFAERIVILFFVSLNLTQAGDDPFESELPSEEIQEDFSLRKKWVTYDWNKSLYVFEITNRNTLDMSNLIVENGSPKLIRTNDSAQKYLISSLNSLAQKNLNNLNIKVSRKKLFEAFISGVEPGTYTLYRNPKDAKEKLKSGLHKIAHHNDAKFSKNAFRRAIDELTAEKSFASKDADHVVVYVMSVNGYIYKYTASFDGENFITDIDIKERFGLYKLDP